MQFSLVYKTIPIEGDPALVRSVAKFFSMLMRRNIDPNREVVITVGAQQGLNAAIRAYLDPGQECIIFEPAYLLYEPLIRLSNAVPVYVPLRPMNGTNGRYSQAGIANEPTSRGGIGRGVSREGV